MKLGNYFLVDERVLGISVDQQFGAFTFHPRVGTVIDDFARMGRFCGNRHLYNLITTDYTEKIGEKGGETNLVGMVVNWNPSFEKEVESKKSTGLSSIITLNGFYYAIGYEGMFGSGRDDLLLLKFDKNGNIVWKKLLGGKFEDAGIWLCGENDYLYLVGYKDRNGDSIYDFWILKFKIH